MSNKSKVRVRRKANNDQEAFGIGFKVYDPTAFDLIALHFWTDKRRFSQGKLIELGKAPIDTRWSTMAVNSRATRERCIEEGRNMGVRLRHHQLVMDVDPRNYSDHHSDSFLKLCSRYRLNASKWPRVLTGSGGFHCYLSLPEGTLVRETLAEFPGIEFKSIGRQVVAAGSRHPNGQYYRWSPDYPSIRERLPMMPRALLEAIRRPIHMLRHGGEGGIYDADELELMLSALDVEAFRNHQDWLQLMFACHHATAGDGEEVFVRWSTSDPNYDDHEEIVTARWRSCTSDKGKAVTYRTLNMILRKHGAGHLVPVPDDDFPSVGKPRCLGKAKPPRVIGKVRR